MPSYVKKELDYKMREIIVLKEKLKEKTKE